MMKDLLDKAGSTDTDKLLAASMTPSRTPSSGRW